MPTSCSRRARSSARRSRSTAGPERLDPPRELIDVAIEYDCWFSIDSDAHATGQLEWQPHGCDRAAERGVPIDKIINTMPADELVGLGRGVTERADADARPLIAAGRSADIFEYGEGKVLRRLARRADRSPTTNRS